MSTAPAFTLLHGWGIDARIWQPLTPYWPDGANLSTPDWPGYGDAPAASNTSSLAATASAVADRLPADSIWVGWSLGGLLAVALTEHLLPPRGLILLGAGAQFCAPDGVTLAALGDFTRAFERSPSAAWQHFLRWQSSGEPEPREALKQLTELLGKTPPAEAATLAAGLGFLETLDNRQRLAAPPCPVATLSGENDPFISRPPAVETTTDERLATRLPRAGHCPMVSQPAALADALCRIAARMTHPTEAP